MVETVLVSRDHFGVNGIEMWEEIVKRDDEGKWHLIIKTLGDFRSGETEVQEMSVDELVKWVIDRDAEDEEEYESVDDDEEGDENDQSEQAGREFGERADNLLSFASELGDQACVDALRGWRNGTWPPAPAPPQIIEIGEQFQKGIWIRIYRTAFRVVTDRGAGYIFPPDEHGFVVLHLDASGQNMKWRVQLTEEQLARVGSVVGSEETDTCSVVSSDTRNAALENEAYSDKREAALSAREKSARSCMTLRADIQTTARAREQSDDVD